MYSFTTLQEKQLFKYLDIKNSIIIATYHYHNFHLKHFIPRKSKYQILKKHISHFILFKFQPK